MKERRTRLLGAYADCAPRPLRPGASELHCGWGFGKIPTVLQAQKEMGPIDLTFRVNLANQTGTVEVDNIKVMPLAKADQ